MKLSEMSTDRAADVLVNIVTPISSIATDEELVEHLKAMGSEDYKAQPLIVSIGQSIMHLVPVLLKTHRADLYAIVCEMTGKTLAAVKAQSVMDTMADVRDFLDKDFMDFFISAKK